MKENRVLVKLGNDGFSLVLFGAKAQCQCKGFYGTVALASSTFGGAKALIQWHWANELK